MRWKPAFRILILLLICSASTLVRIFSVIRYESIIHEFDPWFNYRATKFLVNHDFREFWNFFDSESWYPLGRNVGATVYPGLMVNFCSNTVNFWIYLHPLAQACHPHRYQKHLRLLSSCFCVFLLDCRLLADLWGHQKTWRWPSCCPVHRFGSQLHVQIRRWILR